MQNVAVAAHKATHEALQQAREEADEEIAALKEQRAEVAEEMEAVAQKTTTQEQTNTVAGFEVTEEMDVSGTETEEYRNLQERHDAIDDEIADQRDKQEGDTGSLRKQMSFAQQLAEEGFAGVSVISKDLWEQICREAGLYSFAEISSDGDVRANVSSIFWKSELFVGLLASAPVIAGILYGAHIIGFPLAAASLPVITMVGLFNAFVAAGFDKESVPVPVYFFIGVITAIVGFFFSVGVAGAITAKPLKEVLLFPYFFPWLFGSSTIPLMWYYLAFSKFSLPERLLRLVPTRTLYQHLWPSHTSFSGGERVQVLFPDPPDEFKQVLKRAKEAGLNLGVAAALEAMEVEISSAVQQIRQERRERARSWDPIVFAVSDDHSLVAPLAQFGDFPDEKAVIRWVQENGADWILN